MVTVTETPARLVDAVRAARTAHAAAVEHEYAEECALHYARQAARHAPAGQLVQADAWCAAASDKLHEAIVEVCRATAQLQAAEADLDRFQQGWFWTEQWQAGEREASAAIAAGDTVICHSALEQLGADA
jgi:hypothetical protein